jgi:ferredoxin
MAFVITQNCINCKHTNCAEVCPVDCLYESPNFVVIDPRDCIDCGICAAVCPVDAIMPGRDVPEDQQMFIRLNAEMSTIWPSISEKASPPPDADEWDGVPGKLRVLER